MKVPLTCILSSFILFLACADAREKVGIDEIEFEIHGGRFSDLRPSELVSVLSNKSLSTESSRSKKGEGNSVSKGFSEHGIGSWTSDFSLSKSKSVAKPNVDGFSKSLNTSDVSKGSKSIVTSYSKSKNHQLVTSKRSKSKFSDFSKSESKAYLSKSSKSYSRLQLSKSGHSSKGSKSKATLYSKSKNHPADASKGSKSKFSDFSKSKSKSYLSKSYKSKVSSFSKSKSKSDELVPSKSKAAFPSKSIMHPIPASKASKSKFSSASKSKSKTNLLNIARSKVSGFSKSKSKSDLSKGSKSKSTQLSKSKSHQVNASKQVNSKTIEHSKSGSKGALSKSKSKVAALSKSKSKSDVFSKGMASKTEQYSSEEKFVLSSGHSKSKARRSKGSVVFDLRTQVVQNLTVSDDEVMALPTLQRYTFSTGLHSAT